MSDSCSTASESSGYRPQLSTPFAVNYAATLCSWSLLAALFVLVLLLGGWSLGLQKPDLLRPLLVILAFFALVAPMAVYIRRRRNSWTDELDRGWGRRVLALDFFAGALVLYWTGGPDSAFLALAPVVPVALRLAGNVWYTVVYVVAVSAGLTGMIGLRLLGLADVNGSLFDPANSHLPVEIVLAGSAVGGVLASSVLAHSIARVLRHREAEAIAFSEKMNLRAEKLRLLLGVGRTLSRGTSFHEVAQESLCAVHRHFGADATVLYLLEGGGGELKMFYSLGEGAEREAGDTTLARATLGTRAACLWPASTSGEKARQSTMVVPLLVENTCYGAIKVVAPAGVTYNTSKLALLETIAAELGSMLRTADAYQASNAELSRATKELAALNTFTRKVSSSFDLRAICESLLSTAVGGTGSHYGNLTLLPDAEGDESIALYHNYPPSVEARLRASNWREAVGIYGRCLRTRRPVLVPDVQAEEDYVAILPDVRSKLCVPVLVEGIVVGMVNLESRSSDGYSQTDVDFMAALAESTAVAVKNARLYLRVEQMALHDGLTGLFDHSYFHQALDAELDRCRRHRRCLSLVVLDVDDFKLYNDHHGHQAGDQVLRWLGQLLRMSTRRSDAAARYGGEEFAVIMPETTHDEALRAAEKLREAIDTRQPELWPEHVTVSVGVAAYPDDATTGMGLVDVADGRMYSAKRAGKNQVVAAG